MHLVRTTSYDFYTTMCGQKLYLKNEIMWNNYTIFSFVFLSNKTRCKKCEEVLLLIELKNLEL